MPENLGILGLLQLARMITPPGHEIVGFEDENGVFYSLAQLEALEGQEIRMNLIQKAIDSLNGGD